MRLLSFTDWSVPSDLPSKEKMAYGGFVYSPRHKNVHRVCCPFCNVVLDKWNAHTEPLKEHEIANKYCAYLKFIKDPRVIYALQKGFPEDITLKTYQKYHHYKQSGDEFVNLLRNYTPYKQKEDFLCKKCYVHYREVVYMTCRHMDLCKKCAKTTAFCVTCHYKPILKIEIE